MPSYKLTYFDAKGIAEVSRQIFVHAGQPYEDVRVTKEEWQTLKPKTPFGTLPVLEVDGKPIPQSAAIARFLAKKFDLAGKTDLDAATVDAFVDQFKDYLVDFNKYGYVALGFREGDKDALLAEHGGPARDKFFTIVTKQLVKNKNGFLVGGGLTFADLFIAQHVEVLQDRLPGFLDAYPEVRNHQKKIHSLPKIKEWIEKRPKNTI